MIAAMGVTRKQDITVVTGGGRGIGAAICTRLAAEGHDVVIGYRADAARAEAVAETVRAAGRRTVTVAMDTASPSDVDRLFDALDRATREHEGLSADFGRELKEVETDADA